MIRIEQRFPVTPSELSIVAIMSCTAAAYIFWLHKPLSVELPTFLKIDVSIVNIRLRAGEAARDLFQDAQLEIMEHKVYTSDVFCGERKRFSWFTLSEQGLLNRLPMIGILNAMPFINVSH